MGGELMFFHVILTTECNLQCRYCFGETLDDFDEDFEDIEVDYSLPKKIAYDFSTLAEFCIRDPECVLTFYGGEPLLCTEEIEKIMDSAKPRHFMIQTNGIFLDRLPAEYVNRFHTILVSIDGDEALTDSYRGKGVFRKVIDNLKLIKKNGYGGELIARMTVMEQTDLYKQVTWLLDNPEFSFSSVHWQLNAGFWGNDFSRRNFEQWSETSYVPGLKRLTQFWVDQMETGGIVIKLYPLLGIAHSLLHNENNSLLRCGSGWINYAIQTDGYIIPCPTMWGMKDFYFGHISNANPLELKKIFAKSPCSECDILGFCGGRCLYANITNRWSKEAYATVCRTVKGLMDAAGTELPRMKHLISEGKVNLSDFEFIKYNGCEIIP
jgi:putative peptide-modifying radical SAM enzyme